LDFSAKVSGLKELSNLVLLQSFFQQKRKKEEERVQQLSIGETGMPFSRS
jgi:hypothetical protein